MRDPLSLTPPETARGILAASVIVAALVSIAIGRLPNLRMNRASLAFAANIGSAARIIGNPQNMLIGSQSGISFGRFFVRMALPSLPSTAVAYAAILIAFKREFATALNRALELNSGGRSRVAGPLGGSFIDLERSWLVLGPWPAPTRVT